MNMTSPCKGCTNRHTACHGKCDVYQEWRDEYHARMKYLEETKDRLYVPLTESRRRAYTRSFNQRGRDKHYKGGWQ